MTITFCVLIILTTLYGLKPVISKRFNMALFVPHTKDDTLVALFG